jgi:hypothetical protein
VCDFGGPTVRVHLVGVLITFEKNFYRLPFTPPSLVAKSVLHFVVHVFVCFVYLRGLELFHKNL